MYIIVGLGNPGKQYQYTRHNAGFIAVDYLAAQEGIAIKKIKHKAVLGEGSIGGEKVVLAKPQTFMNNSGESIRELLTFYKLDPSHLIVIYDDVSMEPGRLRIRAKGSDGGHNGIKSIIYLLESDAFPRVKIGVGAPPAHYDLADWVLGRFTDADIEQISPLVDQMPALIETIIQDGVSAAMNRFNN